MQVLVVGDETTSRLVVAAAVREHGHHALLAEDGQQAWSLYRAHRPEVVLADLRMHGFDGVELVRRIRAEHDDHRAHVVLVTAMGSREQVVEGMEAGADDFLVAPIDPLDLQVRLIASERTSALHRRLAEATAELGRVNADLNLLARTDPLTQVGNRLRFDEDLATIHARAIQHEHAYAIALADLDHFKTYNDTYGHPAGDEALHAVATTLQDACRITDRVYRYGGEELAVLLPATELHTAALAAERLRAAIEELAIQHEARPDDGDVLTVSIGIAALDPTVHRGPHEVLDQADLALYRAKARGRNRVAGPG